MKQKRQTKIEQHEISTIQAITETYSIHCKTCQKESAGVPPKEVSTFFSITLDEIIRKIGTGEFHLTNNRLALICKNSIEKNSIINQK